MKTQIGVVVSDTYADITGPMLKVAEKHAEFLDLEIKKTIHVPPGRKTL